MRGRTVFLIRNPSRGNSVGHSDDRSKTTVRRILQPVQSGNRKIDRNKTGVPTFVVSVISSVYGKNLSNLGVYKKKKNNNFMLLKNKSAFFTVRCELFEEFVLTENIKIEKRPGE